MSGRVRTDRCETTYVEDGVATVQRHAVLETLLALSTVAITRVGDPSIGLHQDGGAEVLVLVPPVRGARGRAAGAENALVHAVELLTVFLRLVEFSLWDVVILEVRLDRLVLLVELGEVGNKVFDNVHWGEYRCV